MDFYITYHDRSRCVLKKLGDAVRSDGFVNEDCYGIDTGNSSIMWISIDNDESKPAGSNLKRFTLNNTADPFQIFACIVGGRIPGRTSRKMPMALPDLDLVAQPTNMILSQTFQRGSEELFVNFYGMLELVGCLMFASWNCWHVGRFLRLLWQHTDDRDLCLRLWTSLVFANIASCVWAHQGALLQTFGFVGIVAWYINTVRTYCTWFVDGQDVWTLNPSNSTMNMLNNRPEYVCKAGSLSSVLSTKTDLLRLWSVSYTMFIILCRGSSVHGLTRLRYGFIIGLTAFGIAPTLCLAVSVTAINHARLQANAWTVVHNQLFVASLWLIGVGLLRLARDRILTVLMPLFRLCGVERQEVANARLLHMIVGSYYFVSSEEFQLRHVHDVPLSVLLECSHFCMDYVNPETGAYVDACVPSRKGPDVTLANPSSGQTLEFLVHFKE